MTELGLLMTVDEFDDFTSDQRTKDIEAAEKRLRFIDDLEKQELLTWGKKTAEILADIETDPEAGLKRLENYIERQDGWEFVDDHRESVKAEIADELETLRNTKPPTPWERNRELNDRYQMLGTVSLNAANLCDQIREIADYKETATKAGQLFVRVALEMERTRLLPKDTPKNRAELRAQYAEAWGLLQGLIDQGLDTVPFGYATLERRVQIRWDETPASELGDDPF